MQRIKYIKCNDTEYRSKHSYTSIKGITYRVFLYTDTMTYKIKNERGGYATFNRKHKNKNLRALKRNAKRKLIELGVNFDIELRIISV